MTVLVWDGTYLANDGRVSGNNRILGDDAIKVIPVKKFTIDKGKKVALVGFAGPIKLLSNLERAMKALGGTKPLEAVLSKVATVTNDSWTVMAITEDNVAYSLHRNGPIDYDSEGNLKVRITRKEIEKEDLPFAIGSGKHNVPKYGALGLKAPALCKIAATMEDYHCGGFVRYQKVGDVEPRIKHFLTQKEFEKLTKSLAEDLLPAPKNTRKVTK